jgi:hypothetical protein
MIFFSLKEFCSGLIELIHFNVVIVVVGDEKLQKSIVVEVVSSQGADCSSKVLDSLPFEGPITLGSEKMSRVVTVTSNEDVRGRLLRRLDDVRETWAHVRYQKGKGVFESVGNGAAGEVSVENVLRDIIQEDCCL